MRPIIFWTLVIGFVCAEQAVLSELKESSFHPRSYSKRVACCPAVNRQTNQVSDINISYVDINPTATTTLLLVHGWPGLWSSWSNQILEFQDSYHLLTPDLRGFGESTHPGDVQASGTMGDIVGDLVCLLEHAKVSSAVCVGHDWGAVLCYEAARMRPELFEGIVGAVVPYIPAAGPFMSVEELASHMPPLSYEVYFQKYTEEAITELNRDIRKSLRATYRTVDHPPPPSFLKSTTGFLDAYGADISPSPFYSEEEEDYLVEQYSIQGFNHTLQFYTHENHFTSHAFGHAQGNHTLTQPTLAIYPSEDPVGNWVVIAAMLHSADFLPNLKVEIIRAAHWPQLEAPQQFNKMMRSWLNGFEAEKEAKLSRINDEL